MIEWDTELCWPCLHRVEPQHNPGGWVWFVRHEHLSVRRSFFTCVQSYSRHRKTSPDTNTLRLYRFSPQASVSYNNVCSLTHYSHQIPSCCFLCCCWVFFQSELSFVRLKWSSMVWDQAKFSQRLLSIVYKRPYLKWSQDNSVIFRSRLTTEEYTQSTHTLSDPAALGEKSCQCTRCRRRRQTSHRHLKPND